MCGSKMTLGDLIVFNDVLAYMETNKLTAKSPETKDLPNLMRWYEKVPKDMPAIQEVIADYRKALEKTKPAQLA